MHVYFSQQVVSDLTLAHESESSLEFLLALVLDVAQSEGSIARGQ